MGDASRQEFGSPNPITTIFLDQLKRINEGGNFRSANMYQGYRTNLGTLLENPMGALHVIDSSTFSVDSRTLAGITNDGRSCNITLNGHGLTHVFGHDQYELPTDERSAKYNIRIDQVVVDAASIDELDTQLALYDAAKTNAKQKAVVTALATAARMDNLAKPYKATRLSVVQLQLQHVWMPEPGEVKVFTDGGIWLEELYNRTWAINSLERGKDGQFIGKPKHIKDESICSGLDQLMTILTSRT